MYTFASELFWFLEPIWMVIKKTLKGSNLQCCLHATVLLAVNYSNKQISPDYAQVYASWNAYLLCKYILLVRIICEKYRFRGQANCD
jgi:hypothetical protein